MVRAALKKDAKIANFDDLKADLSRNHAVRFRISR
jgi:hypothetical protein